jgi:hypothetical protein
MANAVGCKVHLHLANHSADVRWFDVFQQRTVHREIDPQAADFMRVMSELQPISEAENDEKFAFAA